MKVFVSPCDQSACGFYRLIWPARAVAATHEMHVTVADDRYIGWRMDDFINYLTPQDARVVVIQRPLGPTTVDAIPRLQSRGIAVVCDMDDDLSCVHPNNAAHLWALDMHEFAVKACQMANLVTVTTDALAEVYAPHGRVRVLPNCVPSWYLKIPHRDTGDIGWGGALRSHPGDLDVLGRSIANLVSRGIEFRVVGPMDGVGKTLGLTSDPRCTDGVPLVYWPRELAKIGIGIAPLALSTFNASKSRLRPLEYSAVGVPWVASPTPDYIKFHEQGVGLLASSPEEWEEHLWSLHVDRYRRDALADAGRELAKANTVEARASDWIEAWTYAGESVA